jgi:hypothetical protein
VSGPLWPPERPERCPDCANTIPDPRYPDRVWVLYDELSSWFCIGCANRKMLALGLEIPEGNRNRPRGRWYNEL